MREKLSLTQRKRFCVSILLVVACLIFAIQGFADHRLGHRPPKGGGDVALATVSLTGAFVFDGGALPVTLKTKLGRTIARSAENVEMFRPDEVSFPEPEFTVAALKDLQDTWDFVFADCPVLLKGVQQDSIFVGDDDWYIEFFSDEIRLKLFGIVGDPDITLQLIGVPVGVPDYDRNPIPPAENGPPSVFELDKFIISARSPKGRTKVHCHPEGEVQFHFEPLGISSFLSITAP